MVKSVFWKDVLFPSDLVDLRSVGNEGVVVPGGTTAERPVAPVDATIRWNADLLVTEIYQDGTWSALNTGSISGEANTASNLGAGQPIFSSKVGVDLQFKSLVAGSNIALVSGPNTITINASTVGESNTGANSGGGEGIYDSKVGTVLNFKSLLTTTPAEIAIVPTGGSEIDIQFIGSLGETNTASNLGGGSQVFESKVGTVLRFRTITSGGAPITLTSSATEIEIAFDDDAVLPGTGAITLPTGNTAARPGVPTNGMIRYNSQTNVFEGYVNSSWATIEASSGTFLPLAGGTLTGNLDLTGTNINMNSGGDINMAGGDVVFTLGGDIIMGAGSIITMAASATVDGRDVSADGLVLDSINTTNGVIVRTGSGTFTGRTITGTANQITITNGSGVAGNPTIALATDPVVPGSGAITIPSGNTAARPGTPSTAMVRVNTTDNVMEYYVGGSWVTVLDSNGITMNGDIDLNGNNIIGLGLVDGRDVATDGLTIDDLVAIANDTGFITRSGGTLLARIIVNSPSGGLDGINVVGGDGSADVEIGLDIHGLTSLPALDNTDEVVVYDASTGNNRKITVQDIIDAIGTDGLDDLYLNVIGDTMEGIISLDGGSITMTDNRASVLGTGGTTVLVSGSFTINGISISVTASDDPGIVAGIINGDSNIITDGTIFADVVGAPNRLRIYKTGGGSLVLADTSNTPLADLGITPGTYSAIGTVDGRDLSDDGGNLDALNLVGQFGFITRTADGSPASFSHRTITASSTSNRLGLEVLNGNGSGGNPTVGLNITGLTSEPDIDSNDEMVFYDNSISTNRKVILSDLLAYMQDNMNGSYFRAEVTSLAVVDGVSEINFSTGSETFDLAGEFNPATGRYTPRQGLYRLTVFVSVDSSTDAGNYTVKVRKNGTPTAVFGLVVADGTNPSSVQIDEMLEGNGTDFFSIEITNGTGSGSTLASVVFLGNREF